jgi:tripartite-type tricarboxylate transporter receptor subunit TctC
MYSRRKTIMSRSAILAVLLCLAAAPAIAQPYPNKPIRVIVPWPPTGTVDILGRALSQKLSESLGQNVVVDNRGGANGAIGTEMAAKAAPDGYTLLVENLTGETINAALRDKMPFDIHRDLAPISLLAWVPNGVVSLPTLPAKTIQELIALAKSQPGKLTYASFGIGSSAHLTFELFKGMTGIDMLHVPYKGGQPAIADLLAGQVSIYIPVLPSVVQLSKAGRLRLLAVTSAKRSSAVPDVPTVSESGVPGFEASNWFGFMAPAGTPPEIVSRLNAETLKALQSADMREKLAGLGFETQSSTPQELSALLKKESEKWGRVVKASGARAE